MLNVLGCIVLTFCHFFFFLESLQMCLQFSFKPLEPLLEPLDPDEWEENRQLELRPFKKAKTMKIEIVKKNKKICRICAKGFQRKRDYWPHLLECMVLIKRRPKPHHLHLQLLLRRYLATPAK